MESRTRKPCEIRVFHSFEEENDAEHQRRALMTPEERLLEFAELQRRAWGDHWGTQPMVKQATWEKLAWFRMTASRNTTARAKLT